MSSGTFVKMPQIPPKPNLSTRKFSCLDSFYTLTCGQATMNCSRFVNLVAFLRLKPPERLLQNSPVHPVELAVSFSDPVAFLTLSRAVCTFDISMARAVDMSKGVRHDAGVIDIGHHQMVADDKCSNRRRPSSEDHFVVADWIEPGGSEVRPETLPNEPLISQCFWMDLGQHGVFLSCLARCRLEDRDIY